MTVKQRRDNSKLSFKKLKFLHNHHFAFLVIFLLLVIISINNIKFTGYSIIYVDEVVEEPVNLVLNSSYNYNSIIDIENFDHIKSLKLTGRVAKEGIVKVYFNDILVLDNSALVNSENKVTGLSILNETSEVNISENETVEVIEILEETQEENLNVNETNVIINNTEENNEVVENIQDYILIDLDNYCLDSCNLFVNNSEITLNFEISNSSIEIDEISYTVVKAENELESVSNSSEVTLNDGIVVEKDIVWTKIVELEEIGRVNVSLPSLARNIRVKKIIDDNEVEVSKVRYDIDNSNLIDLVNPILVNIYDDALKYKIYYDTPGPDKTESALIKDKYKLLKNISVSSELDLQNITSYVDLPNVLKQQIKLKWYDGNNSQWVDITDNETYNLTFYDSNDDGKFERVYWNIPHLSDQDFSLEINLLILNIQSYPVVGGNWSVNFNTTGTADLTIEAVDGTTWSNINDNNDLRFLELKCGSNLVNYDWIGNKVFIGNYNCDGLTGVEVSKVISQGGHHLKFTFGNLVGYANNVAYDGGYGYNSTDNSFTDMDGLNFKADNNGILTIRQNERVLGKFGFGITATFQANNYNYTSEDFTWTWSISQVGSNYTFSARNNWSAFNWTQYYDFSPETSVKIKHIITNNLGAPITNGKLWYIHTIENNTMIYYNLTEYIVGTGNIHLQGNFNSILPYVNINDDYLFKYDDLILSNFTISDIYIGDGSLIQHPNTLIMAIGITKGIGTLPNGASITLDPTIQVTGSIREISMAPINETAFVMAYVDHLEEDVSFKIYMTNGTLLKDVVDVDTTADVDSRVDVTPINSTSFVIAWIDGQDEDASFEIYDNNGIQMKATTDIDTTVGNRTTISVIETGTNISVCYTDAIENNADMIVYNNNGLNPIPEIDIDNYPNIFLWGSQVYVKDVLCSSINSTNYFYALFRGNNLSVMEFNYSTTTFQPFTNVAFSPWDISLWNMATASLDARDGNGNNMNMYILVYFDWDNSDLTYTIRTVPNKTIVAPTDIDTSTAFRTTMAVAAINNGSVNDSAVIVWSDPGTIGGINATVIDNMGNIITPPFLIDSAPYIATSNTPIDVISQDMITGNSLCNSTFVVSYVNSTNVTIFKSFRMNGTTWDGICPSVAVADTPPNWSSPSINQTTVLQNQWINFSTIWSDDIGLSTYILEINQTGNYINSTPTLFPTTGTLQNSSNVGVL